MRAPQFVEVRVRAFFTSDEADVAPSSTVLLQILDDGRSPDWSALMGALPARTADQIAGLPVKNLREMTRDEIDAYRDSEGVAP